MFDNTKVTDALYGIVGLRQPNDPDYAILDVANTTSRSGLFVTDIPHAKIQYLKDNNDFSGITDSAFNTFLKEMQKAAISEVCAEVFNRPDYLDRQVFYKNANNKVEQDILPDGFVGFRMRISHKKNVAFKITRVLLEFDTTGSFDLLLYNSAKKAPIQTKAITITSTQQEETLDWVLDNTDDYYKGDYYLGYVKDGTTPIPFKRERNNASILSCITDMGVEKIAVPGHVGTDIWDFEDEDGLSEDTGLNPDVTVYDDFTDMIIQNEHLFARAVYLSMGIRFLGEYAASLRSNRNERTSSQLLSRILQEIEGQDDPNFQKVTGLRPQMLSGIKRIRAEIDKLRGNYFTQGPTVTTLN